MYRHLFRKCLTGLCATFAALLLSEVFLRILGEQPWHQLVTGELRELTTEPHPILGWWNKPGTYKFLVGHPITNTILENRQRFTGIGPEAVSERVMLFGDSVMYGYGVDDKESVGFRLQTLLPAKKIENHAVPGYGLLQSIFALRTTDVGAHTTVVYNLERYIEDRDVASFAWTELITELSSRLNIRIPYIEISSDERFVNKPADWYWAEIPFRRHSALISIAQRGLARYQGRIRLEKIHEVNEYLIRQLQDEVRARGARLLITGFSKCSPDDRKRYETMLMAHGIDFEWCLHPRLGDPDLQLPNDPHPTGEVHGFMAECLANKLR